MENTAYLAACVEGEINFDTDEPIRPIAMYRRLRQVKEIQDTKYLNWILSALCTLDHSIRKNELAKEMFGIDEYIIKWKGKAEFYSLVSDDHEEPPLNGDAHLKFSLKDSIVIINLRWRMRLFPNDDKEPPSKYFKVQEPLLTDGNRNEVQ